MGDTRAARPRSGMRQGMRAAEAPAELSDEELLAALVAAARDADDAASAALGDESLDRLRRRSEAERELRAESEALAREAEESARRLQVAERDFQTFANSASHDLRAPIRGAGVLAADIRDALDRGDDAEAREALRLLEKENARATRLLHDLLGFAKSSRQDVRPRLVDVSALAHAIVEDIAAAHPGRRTAWDVQEGMRAYADPALLRIALAHLMENASKFSARSAAPRVRVSGTSDPSGTTIEVADNGVGFPPSESYRLFGPFQRLSTAQGFEGTGLGLAAVHRIAARHGGAVEGEGAHGQGARFRLRLPSAAGADAAAR